MDTKSLGLSDDLFGDFKLWVGDWHANFLGRNRVGGMLIPVWTEGFDSSEWHSRGVALMRRLQDERPDLEVRNGFDADIYPTDPFTHTPQMDA